MLPFDAESVKKILGIHALTGLEIVGHAVKRVVRPFECSCGQPITGYSGCLAAPLLSIGVDGNAISEEHGTLLCLAALTGNEDLIQALMASR